VGFVELPAEWINQRPSEGFIDQAELDLVLLNWGASIAPLGAVSVPEPSTAWMIVVGFLAVGVLRHRATLEY
jgi:hypothetical protein